MIAEKRRLKDGSAYDRFFPKAKGVKQIVIQSGATVESTIELVKKAVSSTLHETKALAQHLSGNNRLSTSQNIYNFIIDFIQYRLDNLAEDVQATERVRTPARSWHDRKAGVDCEDFSILISSVLTNLGIPHSMRITKYGGKSSWQHIYVVVPDGNKMITVDPVVDYRFNYEVPYSEKRDYPMPVRPPGGPAAGGPVRATNTGALAGISLPAQGTLCCNNQTMTMKGIDAMELGRRHAGRQGTMAGLGNISPALIEYVKSKATGSVNTEARLKNKMGGTIDYARRQNNSSHILWPYVQIALSQGIEAAKTAIMQDIAPYLGQILPGAVSTHYTPASTPSGSQAPGSPAQGSYQTGPGAMVPYQTQTAGVAGGGLLDKLKQPKTLAFLAGAGVLSYALLKPNKAAATTASKTAKRRR